MRFRAFEGGVVEFQAGGEGEPFEVSFDVVTLRQFIDLGLRALVEANALDEEDAEAKARVA